MPKLEIYTLKGTILDTIPCSPAETVKELVKNALESKKLRIEEAICLKQQEKDGNWTKIRARDKVRDENAIYRITRDPEKMCLKHRVRVIDYEGRELALLPTKCGMIVGNIANDVCCQLGVDPKYVYLIEKVENGKILSVKADSKVDWDQKVIITLDLADNERFVIKRGEPILPKCLTKVTLKQLLIDYKNSIPRASRSTTKFLDDLVTKLETGESPNEPEKRLIAKACAPPLERHSLHRGLTWKREARRYLTHLFKPYPQLQIPDFVSNSGDAEDPGFMMSRLRLDYRQNDLKRRDLLLNLIKN